MSEPVALTFDIDNPCNTTIRERGQLAFMVATDFADKSKPVTRVRDRGGALVAEWVRRGWRSDLLTMGGRSFPASSWLKKSIMPFNDSVSFEDDRRRKYLWGNNSPGLQLQLFSQDDKTQPIARFRRAHRNKSSGAVVPAGLVLDGRADEIRTLVVVSFLILERPHRERTTETASRADALAQPLVTPGLASASAA